jgi:L-iditol 2-dehydrogenase
VIVAASNTEVFSQAFSFVRRGGVISVFGAPTKDAVTSLSLGRLFYNEVSILPSYSTTEVETEASLELIRLKRIDVS